MKSEQSTALEAKFSLNHIKVQSHIWHSWTKIERKIFIDWVVRSLRQSTDIEGLYYQTDIKSKYAAEKRNQHFRKEIIEIAVSNLHALVKREENDEIRAIYGVGS